MTHPHGRRRPQDRTASVSLNQDTPIVAAREDATQTRCRRCGHLLTVPASVRAELGPVCAVVVDDLEAVAR